MAIKLEKLINNFNIIIIGSKPEWIKNEIPIQRLTQLMLKHKGKEKNSIKYKNPPKIPHLFCEFGSYQRNMLPLKTCCF